MRVRLNGIVTADEDLEIYQWFGYQAFSPETVRHALESTPSDEELILEINSGGGSVWAGSEIYTVLRSSNVKTRAEIQSLAASAASYLAMGCDVVQMSPVAQMMMHLPATRTSGDRNDHSDSIQFLDSVAESILNVYEAKSKGKKTRAELASMMAATTWLTAQEAEAAGLVDGILYQDAPADVLNAAGGACAVPDISQLRAEYRKMKGKPPMTPNNEWQQQARQLLDIEKNRF